MRRGGPAQGDRGVAEFPGTSPQADGYYAICEIRAHRATPRERRRPRKPTPAAAA